MNALPYDLFIRYLVTRGIIELDAVNAELVRLCLPKITKEQLTVHYNLVNNHLPQHMLTQWEKRNYTSDFMQWMKVLEVSELWFYGSKEFRSKDYQWVKLVYDIHSDLTLRLAINALVMKGIKDSELCETINIKYAAMIKPIHLKLYRSAFWNPERMTRASWRSYLGKVETTEKLMIFTALTEDVEVVKTELGLPSRISLSDSLQYLLSSSYNKARFYLKQSSPTMNKEARHWITTVMQLADKYDKHRTGDIQDFGKTLQMEFEFVENEFPIPDPETLAQLKKESEERMKTGEDAENEGAGGV